MLIMTMWSAIRIMREKGESIKGIARTLKISKNTVRKALRSESYPEYAGINKKTDNVWKSKSRVQRFKERIKRMYIEKGFIGSRILEEIKKEGFEGSSTSFYEYFLRLRGNVNLSKISERYETPAGDMGQFDWSPYRVAIAGEGTRIYLYSTILACSRKRKYSVSLDQKQGSIFDALENAFSYFGGVPKRLLVDNAKVMVTSHTRDGIEWNKHYLGFMGHYRIIPEACQVRRARTKGKVENPFFYLEQHFIKGNEFKSFEDLVERLDQFNEMVNNRVHQATGESPNARFIREEKEFLKALPASTFLGTHMEMRKVNHDCLISLDGHKYSVPHLFAGKQVWVRVYQGNEIRIFSAEGRQIACHKRSLVKPGITTDSRHYMGLRKMAMRDRELVLEKFKEIFPEELYFMRQILSHQPAQARYHLAKILEAEKYYSKGALLKAIRKSTEYGSYNYKTVLGILRAEGSVGEHCTTRIGRLERIKLVNIKRGLEIYRMEELTDAENA